MPMSIRLPVEAEKRLAILSKETGRSKSYYIRESIMNYLDEMEDIYIASDRLENIKAGKTEIYTLEEVGRELGLES